jgi:hypothetical protein
MDRRRFLELAMNEFSGTEGLNRLLKTPTV